MLVDGTDANMLIQHMHFDLHNHKLIAVTVFVSLVRQLLIGTALHRWLLQLCCGFWDCSNAPI